MKQTALLLIDNPLYYGNARNHTKDAAWRRIGAWQKLCSYTLQLHSFSFKAGSYGDQTK